VPTLVVRISNLLVRNPSNNNTFSSAFEPLSSSSYNITKSSKPEPPVYLAVIALNWGVKRTHILSEKRGSVKLNNEIGEVVVGFYRFIENDLN